MPARALEIARTQPGLRARLAAHVARVRSALRSIGLPLDDGPAPIICVDARSRLDFAAIAGRLFDEESISVLHVAGGYAIVFTLSALHDEEQIECLMDAFRCAI